MFRDDNRLRLQIRYEAARIMVEDGVRDYQRAKRKACMRLGVSSRRSLPTNLEIEDAVSTQLSLVRQASKDETHRDYIAAALALMEEVSKYSPYLTGAALSGAITASRPIELQVFSSTVEEFCEHLDRLLDGYKLAEKRMRFANDHWEKIPVIQFMKDEIEFEVSIFLESSSYPPLSAMDRKPVKRASLKKVQKLKIRNSCQSS